jgi:hypothetical protein
LDKPQSGKELLSGSRRIGCRCRFFSHPENRSPALSRSVAFSVAPRLKGLWEYFLRASLVVGNGAPSAGTRYSSFAGMHGLLNFIGQPVQMLMQPVEHLTLRLIRGQVAD